MIPVLIVGVLLVAAIFARTHHSHVWVVDRDKASFGNKSIVADLVPYYRGSSPVGFFVNLQNKTERQLTVNWEESYYVRGGSTCGGLFDADRSVSAQIDNPVVSDLVFANGNMIRKLIPVVNVERVPERTETVYTPIIVETPPVVVNPKPPKKKPKDEMIEIELTDGEDIKGPVSPFRDVSERLNITFPGKKDEEDQQPPAVKSELKSGRISRDYTTGSTAPELGEGEHGVLITVNQEGESATQIVLSFKLSYKKVSR